MGLVDTMTTEVGNESVKGVTGEERKRTSIPGVLLWDSSIQFWDNSTRGLDSANALRLACKLRSNARAFGNLSICTLYQASEDISRCFDKVNLLYKGHEIFIGSISCSKGLF